MSSLDDVLQKQKQHQILGSPSQKPVAEASNGSVTFNLYNSSTSSTVYAYVTGLATNNNSATYLLGSDGATPCTSCNARYHYSLPKRENTPSIDIFDTWLFP